MTLPHHLDTERVGIARMAELSGLSKDTLRWYEREGMLPYVARGPDGYRTYTPRIASLIILLSKLRTTGMPTTQMREFAQLVDQGPITHGRRITLLEAHREHISQEQRRLAEASEALESKIAHYEQLIGAGLDCDGSPLNTDDRHLQETR